MGFSLWELLVHRLKRRQHEVRSHKRGRLWKEYLESIRTGEETDYCSYGLEDVEQDVRKWNGAIFGPPGTPYEGGVFYLSVECGEDYPFKPPVIEFQTPIYHPNVDIYGNVHFQFLQDEKVWSPSLTIRMIVLGICSLLDDPDVGAQVSNPIAELYRSDKEKYDAFARAWTREYAMGF